jgi:hypothetical protein
MAKSGAQRVRDYRRGKAHINIWVAVETKKRFVEIATSYQLSQSEFFEKLMASGPVIPMPEAKRVQKEEEEALVLLHECNGDHEMAITKLLKAYKAINPDFVYNKRPHETPEHAEIRKKFRRIRSKLLRWKRKCHSHTCFME